MLNGTWLSVPPFLAGVEFMHTVGVSHLATESGVGVEGAALTAPDHDTNTDVYNAPEVRRLSSVILSIVSPVVTLIHTQTRLGQQFSGIKADLWTTGVLLFAMLFGGTP